MVAGAALVALLVLAGGAVLGYVLYVRHEGRDVRGSSTVEFVPTEPVPTVPEAPAKPAITSVDWPLYGFDSERNRYLPSGLAPPFRRLWVFRARALVEFPPSIAYGRLFFTADDGVSRALDARTGRVVWAHDFKRCTAASPAIAHGVVYQTFLNHPPCNSTRTDIDGLVVAFDARTGRVRWRTRIGPSESSPLVANGLVYVGDWRDRVYALSAATGKVRWSYRTDDKVKGGAALAGRRLYIGSYDGHVYALDARTGKLIWRASAQSRLGGSGRFYSTPAVAYGRVYIGSTDGKVYSFGATTGKLRWSHSTGAYVYASPAVHDGRVFIGSYTGKFYAFDAATGDVRWEFQANGRISGSATVLGKLVYFSTANERTYALDTRTGKLVWSYGDGKYTPLVADTKRVYLVGFTRIYGMVPSR